MCEVCNTASEVFAVLKRLGYLKDIPLKSAVEPLSSEVHLQGDVSIRDYEAASHILNVSSVLIINTIMSMKLNKDEAQAVLIQIVEAIVEELADNSSEGRQVN